MTSKDILRVVPHAHPGFVDILLRASKPMPALEHRLLLLLPRLHEIFVRKQRALGKKDARDWENLLKQETRFIHSADRDV